MVRQDRSMPGQGDCSSVGFKIIRSIKKRKPMAENEFEKNVRREMDEFKVHPSEEVWSSIEKKIRENKRKRRIVFFVLFSVIALIMGGYAIYNFPGQKTKSQAKDNLSE